MLFFFFLVVLEVHCAHWGYISGEDCKVVFPAVSLQTAATFVRGKTRRELLIRLIIIFNNPVEECSLQELVDTLLIKTLEIFVLSFL